jgi:polar amino acid transport system substrate-binding protein
VGVQTGTTGDTAATEAGVPEDNMRRFDTIPLAFQALQNGDVDAVVADEPTAANYVGENPDSLRVAVEAFTTEDYGILVPNDDPELLAALNAAIEKLSASGDIARLAEIHEIE